MGDRAAILNPDTVAWLLDGEDPSVRCFTLTELLGKPAGGSETVAARREIMTTGPVPRILAAQGDDGHYQTDVLEILGILTRLGVRDERMDEALALVAARQGTDGRWKLQSTFNGRFITDIEIEGEPSRWITLRALQVLG